MLYEVITATFIYKHSLQNIGLDDESKESKGTINIYKNANSELFISYNFV